MNETELTEDLDRRGLLSDARNPGVYAVVVDVPDTLDAVQRRWDAEHDARPDDDALDRLATAGDVAYVGASKDVYARLCEHVTGERRRASFLAAYPAVDVVDVWPHLDPFTAEFNRAVRLSHDGFTVWSDGRLFG